VRGLAAAGLTLKFTDHTACACLVRDGETSIKWLYGIEKSMEEFNGSAKAFEAFLHGTKEEPRKLPPDAEVFKFNEAMYYLFHDLWGQALASPAYVKADWRRFGDMLDALGI